MTADELRRWLNDCKLIDADTVVVIEDEAMITTPLRPEIARRYLKAAGLECLRVYHLHGVTYALFNAPSEALV